MRALKLFKIFIKQSIKEMLEYRSTSIFIVIFGLIFFSIEIITGVIYFEYTDTLLGWTKWDYFFIMNTGFIIMYGYNFFFSRSHEELFELIIYGELDYIFIRPINSFYYFSFQKYDIPSIFNVIVCLIFQTYIIKQFKISTIDIFMYFLLIIIGIAYLFTFNTLFITILFWKDKATSLLGFTEYLFDFSTRPRNVFPKFMRYSLSYIIPFLLVINMPIEIYYNKVSIPEIIYYIFYLLILMILVYTLWFLGIKKYQSSN